MFFVLFFLLLSCYFSLMSPMSSSTPLPVQGKHSEESIFACSVPLNVKESCCTHKVFSSDRRRVFSLSLLHKTFLTFDYALSGFLVFFFKSLAYFW